MKIGPDNQDQANRDDCYGFYGTIQINEQINEDKAAEAFSLAFFQLGEATGENPILLRNFLRSKHGRTFANECSNYAGSLEERIQQASGANWITRSLVSLIGDGYEFHLFEDEQIDGE